MINDLLGYLPKKDQEDIKNQIEERFKQFMQNQDKTLTDVEWKDLVWPSIKRMDASYGKFKS